MKVGYRGVGVCVFSQSPECQAYHFSVTWYLTIVGGFLFLMVGFQPPLRGILNTLRLRLPTGISDNDPACNDGGG